jgi:glycine cleavage system protein P-like pyridoxal-binding family
MQKCVKSNLIPVSADEGSLSFAELERLAKDDIAMLIIQSPNAFGIIEATRTNL